MNHREQNTIKRDQATTGMSASRAPRLKTMGRNQWRPQQREQLGGANQFAFIVAATAAEQKFAS
jgi:hypothetical protein